MNSQQVQSWEISWPISFDKNIEKKRQNKSQILEIINKHLIDSKKEEKYIAKSFDVINERSQKLVSIMISSTGLLFLSNDKGFAFPKFRKSDSKNTDKIEFSVGGTPTAVEAKYILNIAELCQVLEYYLDNDDWHSEYKWYYN